MIKEEEYTEAQKELLRTAELAELKGHPAIEGLLYPNNIFEVYFPIEMDNGKIKWFYGIRVQHNNALGPYKGGFKFFPLYDVEKFRRMIISLSMWMTWKSALLGLPFGGAKGGVMCNPKEMSEKELERLTRAYARTISPYVGDDIDIPAPDVYTNAKVMAWFLDEIEQVKGRKMPGVVTGKPIILGGSQGRDAATGGGVAICTREIAKCLGIKPEQSTAIIDGYGNVGSFAALDLYKMSFRVIGASDSKGGIYNVDGINPKKVLKHKQGTGSVVGYTYKGTVNIASEELFKTKCNFIIPSSIAEVINIENVHSIDANAIIEGANGPITTEADMVLKEKGIEVVPGILANGGGVIVSFFEWVQNLTYQKWTLEEVNEKMEKMLVDAFYASRHTLKELKNKSKDVNMRDAAMVLAVRKVVEAMELRGIKPKK